MTIPTRRAVRLVLAATAIGSGVIHLSLAPEHLDEWLPLGIGFVFAGVFSVLWGVAVAVRESRWLLRTGAAFSVLFLAVYLMSRTTGLPVGPSAFRPEAFGAADLVCCALEVPMAIGALLLARRPSALTVPMTRRITAVVIASLALIGGGTGVALAAPAQHGHSHQGGHEPCPAEPVLTGVKNSQGVDTGVTAFFTCKLKNSHHAP
jgi:hypothetical protein